MSSTDQRMKVILSTDALSSICVIVGMSMFISAVILLIFGVLDVFSVNDKMIFFVMAFGGALGIALLGSVIVLYFNLQIIRKQSVKQQFGKSVK